MSRVSQPLQPTPPGDMHSSPGVSSGTCGEAESGTQKTSSRPGERHRNEPQEDAEPCWQGAARSNGNSFDGTRHLSRTRWAELSPSGGKLRLREVACLLASGPRSSPRIPIISSFRGVVGREVSCVISNAAPSSMAQLIPTGRASRSPFSSVQSLSCVRLFATP